MSHMNMCTLHLSFPKKSLLCQCLLATEHSHVSLKKSVQSLGHWFRRPSTLGLAIPGDSANSRQPFLNITTNPSWEIARQLPKSLTCDGGESIDIVVPSDATPAAYHRILAQTTQLIEQHAPNLIVHIGLDVDSDPGVFKIERSAPKEGYHDIPDIDRKVFTRAENKKLFAKAPASLVTTLDIDSAADIWQAACSSMTLPTAVAVSKSKPKGKGANKQQVDVRLSDDVGTYVCGLQYYSSMLHTQRKTGRSDVVFLHVPKLEGEQAIDVGISVAEELIKALVATRVTSR
jgi:pyroglutamyl-peptidase